MDGTLWDAVDSYAEIWNITNNELGIDRVITRDDLLSLMCLTIDRIFNTLFTGNSVDMDRYMEVLMKNESELMPVLGGKLYPGVAEGIRELSRSHNLYMVSNCGADGLRNFLDYTSLKPYFKDTLTYGETNCGKAVNIRRIMERNNLKDAIYIGDTQSDYKSAHEAGIPMIHVTYGFGKAPEAEYQADNFKEIIKILSGDE